MKTLLLDTTDVEIHTNMPEVIRAVENAFKAYEAGTVTMPPKSYIVLPQHNGDFRAMPAYVQTDTWEAAGIKWVNVHPDNPRAHNLPTVMGVLIYSDPQTAFPLSIMDATTLTRKRTGAAAAVATDYLATPDATSLGIVGAGAQSYAQIDAITEVRPITTVIIADRNDDRIDAFIETYDDEYDVRGGSIPDAASCDILSTVTPVTTPIINPDDLGPNTHINAIGADATGKHEISDEILRHAKLVIDDYEQCTHSGEINVPWSNGVLSDTDIHAELGEIVTGNKPGRTTEDDVTVFDSTGLAIQDIAAAHVVYEQATASADGTPYDIVIPNP